MAKNWDASTGWLLRYVLRVSSRVSRFWFMVSGADILSMVSATRIRTSNPLRKKRLMILRRMPEKPFSHS